MSITSETQRKYDPNKGGFAYYTLFHADKGERPSWAQDGDMLEEFGEGGKAYVCSRDAKGRIKWTEKADWDRQTGGGSSGGDGGGLPAEGIANANKFLGFDANGDYTAKDAPSGGGAEKFVVTLTEDDGTWTADKTIAEILEANGDGEIIVGMAEENGLTWEIPCISAVNTEEAKGAIFAGIFTAGDYVNTLVFVGLTQDGSDVWQHYNIPNNLLPYHSSSNNGQVLGVSSGDLAWVDNYAPLVVTMTAGLTEGEFVGDKTYKEVHDAFTSGTEVMLYVYAAGANRYSTIYESVENSGAYTVYFSLFGAAKNASGTTNDFFTVTLGT